MNVYRSVAVPILTSLLLIHATEALGDSRNVNVTVVSTVEELVAAVREANRDEKPDVIRLRPGRYEFVNRFETRFGVSVLPLITTEISLTGQGWDETILDAQFLGRFFTIWRGGRLVVRGMTITQGATDGAGAIGGGAALVIDGSLRMDKSNVIGNQATLSNTPRGSALGGGAIFSSDSKIHIEDSILANNVTDGAGGALFIGSDRRPAILRNVIIDGNRADGRGGAIYNFSERLLIARSTVSRNSAGGQTPLQAEFNGGGGIYNHATVQVSQSAIVENSAGPIASGGGIHNRGTLILRGSTVGANTAGTYGGGLFNSARPTFNTATETRSILENVTMIRNEVLGNFDRCPQWPCTGGGGIWNEFGRPLAMVAVKNSVVAENVIPSDPNAADQDCGGVRLQTLGRNILGTTCSTTRHWQSTVSRTASVDLFGTTPLLGSLIDEESPGHAYYPPLPGSPVIDGVRPRNVVNENPDFVIQTCFKSEDQIGRRRADGDGDGRIVCDIGSIEFPGIAGQPTGWTHQFGNVGEDTTFGLVVFDDFLYATGRAEIALSATHGVPTFGQLASFLRKYDLNGNLEWSVDISILSKTEAFVVAADDTGIYVAGRTEGINPKAAPFGFVNKYDFDGNELWSFGLPDSNGSPRIPWAVSVADDAVFLAGGLRGIAEKPFVARLTADGAVEWITEIVESPESAQSLAINDGRLYVLADDVFVLDTMGNVLRRFNAQPLPGAAIGAANDGVFVAGRRPTGTAEVWKFDVDGNELWRRQTIDNAGELVVAENSVFVCGSEFPSGKIFLQEFSFAGEPLLSRLLGPNGGNNCRALDVSERSIFPGGWTAGAYDGFRNRGGLDAFVARLPRPETSP